MIQQLNNNKPEDRSKVWIPPTGGSSALTPSPTGAEEGEQLSVMQVSPASAEDITESYYPERLSPSSRSQAHAEGDICPPLPRHKALTPLLHPKEDFPDATIYHLSAASSGL